jgi:hypothetical protein
MATKGGDDARSITLAFTVGSVECWRSKEYSLVWCNACAGRSKPVAFVDWRIGDDVLHEVCVWHLGKFHEGEGVR